MMYPGWVNTVLIFVNRWKRVDNCNVIISPPNYRIFPSITRTLRITRTQYFPFSQTFLIDTAHLKIHGIV
jgi:hypothetical protein